MAKKKKAKAKQNKAIIKKERSNFYIIGLILVIVGILALLLKIVQEFAVFFIVLGILVVLVSLAWKAMKEKKR